MRSLADFIPDLLYGQVGFGLKLKEFKEINEDFEYLWYIYFLNLYYIAKYRVQTVK